MLLRAKNITTVRPSKKLDNRQLRLFKIIDAVRTQLYRLKLPPKYRSLHLIFYVLLLKPYHERPRALEPLGVILINGENKWYVKSILYKKKIKGKLHYLVY